MIEVLNINNDAFFPIIDFSFNNNGPSSIILWQFSLEIISREINNRPILDFKYRIDAPRTAGSDALVASSNQLVIQVTNNGWGLARGCEFLFIEPTVSSLFPEEAIRVTANIASGETKEIMTLDLADIKPERFNAIHEQSMIRDRDELEKSFSSYLEWNSHMTVKNGYPEGYLEQSYKKYKREKRAEFKKKWFRSLKKKANEKTDTTENADGALALIPISQPRISWMCRDVRNNLYQGFDDVAGPGNAGDLYLSRDNFVYEESITQSGELPKNMQYCCIVNPDSTTSKHTYAISSIVPSGNTKLFRIMIGATKSCSFDARLALSIDGSKDVETEPVSINIWNPRNSNWGQHFLDGDKIRQKMIDLKHSKGNAPSSAEDEWLIKEWRWLEDKLTDYPFLTPTD